MPYIVGDFLDDIERELVHQRQIAAREVDRAEALYQLRNRALSVSAQLGRAVTAKDVFSSAKNEQERAELRALADRIAPDDPRGNRPLLTTESRGRTLSKRRLSRVRQLINPNRKERSSHAAI